MPWLHVIHGNSFTTKNPIEDVRVDPTYKRLKQQAEDLGMVLSELDDGDEGTHTVFVGYELHPDRHLHQGQTITCLVQSGRKVPAEIISELRHWLTGRGVNFSEAEGIVLSQFD